MRHTRIIALGIHQGWGEGIGTAAKFEGWGYCAQGIWEGLAITISSQTSEGHSDSRATAEFQQLSRRFASQFPPLVAAARKPVIPIKRSESVPTVEAEKPNIKVPEWTSTAGCNDESVPALTVDDVTFRNGGFFKECGPEDQLELSLESVAELLMCAAPKPRAPRVDYLRSGTYIRYSVHNSSTNVTKAFGKAEIFYSLKLDDYTFLLQLILRIASHRSAPLTWQTTRWLLRQLMQDRNLPALENQSEPEQPKPLEIAPLLTDAQSESGHSVPCRWVVENGSVKSQPTRVESNGLLGEDRRSSFPPGLPPLQDFTPAHEFCGDKDELPQALSEMSWAVIRQYRRQMGPYLTDELFVYLLNMFELLTGLKEAITVESALAETRARLGVLAPTPRVLREVHEYWLSRRALLGKPLLREFWPVPSASDNSPFAVFRARTKEKMTLRKPRRAPQESTSRLSGISQEFSKTESLFEASRFRDWIKLQLCDLDALLFEQLWKECYDKSYSHPGWPAARRQLQPQLSEVEKEAKSSFTVPVDIKGFGTDASTEDTDPAFRKPKRRRTVQTDLSTCNDSSIYHLLPSEETRKFSPPVASNPLPVETQPSGPPSSDAVSAPARTPKPFVGPIPLPPIFLSLDPSCSPVTLTDALQAHRVQSLTPIGYIDRSPSAIDDETTQLQALHLGFPCDSPLPTLGDFLASPVSQFPIQQNHLLFRKDLSPVSSLDSFDLRRCPVYRQSLESLPLAVRHETNLRFVIPFGPPPAHPLRRTPTGSNCVGGNAGQASGPPLRGCLRIGRNSRLWLDRQHLTVPTPSDLLPPPLPLHNNPPCSQSPFSIALQSHARRLRTSLQTPTSIALRKIQSLQPMADYITCEDDTSNLLSSSGGDEKNEGESTRRYSTVYSSSGLTLRQVPPPSRIACGAGYSSSGFYPTGVGGPESVLAGSRLADYEPGFVGALGMDSVGNTGGFGLFCAPRHTLTRQELGEELLAAKTSA